MIEYLHFQRQSKEIIEQAMVLRNSAAYWKQKRCECIAIQRSAFAASPAGLALFIYKTFPAKAALVNGDSHIPEHVRIFTDPQ